jgi:hypothetical protein
MPTFNYTVDTQPMAEEIGRVSEHVNATTGAVVAMQTAVIIAERKAADHVCNNVNKGFYSLIRSQISQKLAKLQSEVDSNIMQLVQQRKALLGIKTRMQRDYNMISSRYIKLFNSLNTNLKNRVFELDKPTIDFACKEIDKVSNRTKYLMAIVPITQLESITESQKIIASNIKLRGLNVIKSMKWFVHEMNMQKKLIDQILLTDANTKESAISFMPILMYECNRDKTDQKNIEIIVSDIEIDNLTKSTIKNNAYSEFSKLDWSPKGVPNQEIKSEFSKLLSSSEKSSRIKDLAIQLFQANNYQTT